MVLWNVIIVIIAHLKSLSGLKCTLEPTQTSVQLSSDRCHSENTRWKTSITIKKWHKKRSSLHSHYNVYSKSFWCAHSDIKIGASEWESASKQSRTKIIIDNSNIVIIVKIAIVCRFAYNTSSALLVCDACVCMYCFKKNERSFPLNAFALDFSIKRTHNAAGIPSTH